LKWFHKEWFAGGIIIGALLHFIFLPMWEAGLPSVGSVDARVELTRDSVVVYASGVKKRDCEIIGHQAYVKFKDDEDGYNYTIWYPFAFVTDEVLLEEPRPIEGRWWALWKRKEFDPWKWSFTIDSVDYVDSVLLTTEHVCNTEKNLGSIIHTTFGPFKVNDNLL